VLDVHQGPDVPELLALWLMNIRTRFLLSALAGASLALAGCGRSDAPASNTTAAAPVTDGKRVIEITADDTMKFNVTEIRAKLGEALRVTLKNTGQMPRQVMGHNWVLLKPISEGDLTAFGMKAASIAPDYLPGDRSSVVAHTKLLGGGESDTIEFSAPDAAGEYPFICTFPGHFALMKGKLIVK